MRFGEFELDVRAAELRRDGQKVRLQEQPFRILTMLLERPGEVVLREEIRRRLWPNDTVVEISHGINAAVLRLREALGESAEHPRYIETVARRGYRFRGTTDAESVPAPDPPARTVSHFRLGEKLGTGGMGVVYRAEDLRLGRQVALKLLPEELAGDRSAAARFQREARAASCLNHPNICTIYGVEEHEGQPLIVMELLEGETLEALLARGPLPRARVVALAGAIGAALDAAHRKGVAHRDLKPANVVVSEHGVKVLDFGLAKVDLPASLDGRVTEDGAILGTLHYMSPEQVQGKDAGTASDIFSFGVLLYEMTTGRRAFDGETSADVMAAILKTEPVPTAWAALDALLGRCLAKRPDERCSAGELQAALAALPVEEKPVPMATAPPPFLRWNWNWRPNLRITLGAAGGLVLLLAGVMGREMASRRTEFTLQGSGGAAPNRLSLSPDGRVIGYLAGNRFFIQSLDGGDSRAMEGVATPGSAFWAPDGSAFAMPAAGALRTVRIADGEQRRIAGINTNIAGAWGPNGVLLIGLVGDGIYRVSATGGSLERVTTLDLSRGETRHMLPQFLPDGRRFLYIAATAKPGESMLYAASLVSEGRQAIMQTDSNVLLVHGYLLYTRERVLFARPFDAERLQFMGEPRRIADAVISTPTVGSAVQLADFSATASTLTFRRGAGVTVVRNWMVGF
jgi:DNA-binding winged helix-turn-helix (wHTH) protein